MVLDESNSGRCYVEIPCPTRKHQRSVVTFCGHNVVAMFCIPCEMAWTEPATRAQLREARRQNTGQVES